MAKGWVEKEVGRKRGQGGQEVGEIMLKDWSKGEEDGKSRGQDGQKGPGREATGRGWTWMEGGGGGGGAGGGAGAGAGAGDE